MQGKAAAQDRELVVVVGDPCAAPVIGHDAEDWILELLGLPKIAQDEMQAQENQTHGKENQKHHEHERDGEQGGEQTEDGVHEPCVPVIRQGDQTASKALRKCSMVGSAASAGQPRISTSNRAGWSSSRFFCSQYVASFVSRFCFT